MTESEGSASDMDIVTSDQAGSASVSESESESDTDDQMDDELNLLAPFDSTTAQRHKSTSALWLGVSTPLKAWPAVSSFCPLDVQQVRNLINEFFPGNKPITLELLNLHRFVSTLYTVKPPPPPPKNTASDDHDVDEDDDDDDDGETAVTIAATPREEWRRALTLATQIKLSQLVELTSWTLFREFYKGASMLTYASTWMTKQEVECAKHNSSTLRNNGGGGGGGQANKRKRSHASSNATSGGGRLHHFCVSSPYAVHTGRGLNLAALNSGVHTKKCIVTYMSRMLQPWCAPSLRCCLLDDALGSGPVVLVRVEDFCLVRPAKRSQFLSLIDRYGRECQHQPQPQQQQQEGGDDAMEVFSDNDDDAGDHGSGRRRIGVLVSDSWAEHEAAELRRKVLSCLRVWHLSDENQPLSSKQLESVAKFLAWCATGLDMKLLRTLSSTLSKLLANWSLEEHRKHIEEQPQQGLTLLRHWLHRDRLDRSASTANSSSRGKPTKQHQQHPQQQQQREQTIEERNEWNTVIQAIGTILAGDHADFMLVQLDLTLESLSRTNAYIKAMVERTSCEQMDRDATMQAQGEMAVGLTQAMQACHAKYWPVFGGKLLKHDLNAELVDLFKGVRFAYELGAVHKAKDSRATRRSLKSGSANDGVSAERSEQDEDDAADDDDQVDEQAQEDDGEDVDRRASKQARTSVGAGEAATPEDQSGWDLQVVRSATSGEEHPAIALDGMMEESEESQEEDHGMLGTDLSTITAGGDDLVAGVHAANAEQAWNEYNGQFGGEGVEQVEETQRMTKRDGYGRARAGLMKAKIVSFVVMLVLFGWWTWWRWGWRMQQQPIASEAVVVAGQTGGVESATSGKLDAEVDAKHMVKGRDAVVGGPSMTLAEYAKARGVGASASQEAKWMCESNTGELTEDEWVSKMVECEFGQAFYQLASAWAWLAV